MRFDTLIRGGELVDPGSGRVGRFDLGIAGGRVAAVEPSLPAEGHGRVIDASGRYVTPGLIDLHTHVYWGATYWGVEADPVAARTGVTTWLDVGSTGAYNFPGFRRWIVEPARSRIFGLLNISSIGLTGESWELANLDYAVVDLNVKMIELNRDVLIGVKVRLDSDTCRGTGAEPLRRARAAADRVELPMMVHIYDAYPPLDEIIALMRPGDILTHCNTGASNRIVDDGGRIRDVVKRAWDNGIILDIGHGTGSFSFATTEALLRDGHKPDVISSDIHQYSIQGPMFDLPTTLSKFLALGLTLPEVVERATVAPARAMRKAELGTLAVGAEADVALFELVEGDFVFHDVDMAPRPGRQWLVNTATLRAGVEMPRVPEPPPQPWSELPAEQAAGLTRAGRRAHPPR